MKVNAELNWKGGMAFDAEVDGHIIPLDADATVGGNNAGPRPKKLLLVALGGCTSMDIVSILKKKNACRGRKIFGRSRIFTNRR